MIVTCVVSIPVRDSTAQNSHFKVQAVVYESMHCTLPMRMYPPHLCVSGGVGGREAIKVKTWTSTNSFCTCSCLHLHVTVHHPSSSAGFDAVHLHNLPPCPTDGPMNQLPQGGASHSSYQVHHRPTSLPVLPNLPQYMTLSGPVCSLAPLHSALKPQPPPKQAPSPAGYDSLNSAARSLRRVHRVHGTGHSGPATPPTGVIE